MYTSYWNLRDQPFQNVADTHYAYLSDQHKEGLARLCYVVEEHKLGGMLIGPYGVGKSMVIELLAERVRNRPGTLYMQFDAPPNGTLALAKQIVARLGHSAPIYDQISALDVIHRYFTEGNPSMAHIVLTIDEAQLLRDASTFEFLHLLTNIRITKRDGVLGKSAITLILVGYSDVLQQMAGAPSLAQRLQFCWNLEPLNEQQTMEYVYHRIRASGGDIWLFSEDALKEVYETSGGLPRIINNICDTALLMGCADSASQISVDIVRRAVAELQPQMFRDVLLPEGTV